MITKIFINTHIYMIKMMITIIVIVGFASKFSLKEIRENIRTKFANLRSNFANFDVFLTKFPTSCAENFVQFREIFVQFSFDKNLFLSFRIKNIFGFLTEYLARPPPESKCVAHFHVI